ncbi:MAG: serine hydrolase domain-containing protein [Fimbriimonadaceae bacterium]
MLTLLLGLSAQLSALDQALADFYAKGQVAGVSVAIMDGDRVVYSNQAGYSDAAKKHHVRADTLIRLGSISKSVASVGAMKLVEQRKLNLDEGIRTYVSQWPSDRPQVTLRQLMSHTAGVRHYKPIGPDPTGHSLKAYSRATDALPLFIKDPLINEPGTKYQYSTHAFTIVAAAMESVTNQSFTNYMRGNVFSYAGKGGLDCEVVSDKRPNRSDVFEFAGGAVKQAGAREDNSWKYAGGGLEATAVGLARFATNLLVGKIVNANSLKELWTPAKLKDGSLTTYGLGFGIGKEGFVSHSGAQQGCRTAMVIDRTGKRVVVVLTNTSGQHNPVALAESLLLASIPK